MNVKKAEDIAEQTEAEASFGHFAPVDVKTYHKKMQFDCNLPGLLDEVLNNQSCAILKIPINITKRMLADLAKLAIEIDDDRLHVMMLRLNLYDMPNDKRVKEIDRLEDRIFKRAMKEVVDYNKKKKGKKNAKL